MVDDATLDMAEAERLEDYAYGVLLEWFSPEEAWALIMQRVSPSELRELAKRHAQADKRNRPDRADAQWAAQILL